MTGRPKPSRFAPLPGRRRGGGRTVCPTQRHFIAGNPSEWQPNERPGRRLLHACPPRINRAGGTKTPARAFARAATRRRAAIYPTQRHFMAGNPSEWQPNERPGRRLLHACPPRINRAGGTKTPARAFARGRRGGGRAGRTTSPAGVFPRGMSDVLEMFGRRPVRGQSAGRRPRPPSAAP